MKTLKINVKPNDIRSKALAFGIISGAVAALKTHRKWKHSNYHHVAANELKNVAQKVFGSTSVIIVGRQCHRLADALL